MIKANVKHSNILCPDIQYHMTKNFEHAYMKLICKSNGPEIEVYTDIYK